MPTPAGERVFCVGRLDDDSEGALILTNDGEFCNLVTHPRYGVEKTYRLRVRGRASPELLEKVRKGGSGVFGPVPMAPNPPDKINDADLKLAVEFILKG